MQPRWSFLVGVLLVVCAAGPTLAGTLTSATWSQIVTPYADYPPFTPVTLTRTTAQLGASGTSTATSIAVSLSFPQLTTVLFFPKTSMAALDLQFVLRQGGPQAITAAPSMAGATQGIPGSVVVMTAVHANKGVNASMLTPGIYTLLKVPLSNGQAGQAMSTFMLLGVTVTQTLDFFPWLVDSASFTGLTSKGVAVPDVVVMGSFDLTAMGAGTVTLVSPTKFSAGCSLLTARHVLSLSTLKLTFVPEPATLLLIAAGAAALAWWRRR